MEQVRIIVAIALSLLVFLLFELYFNEKKQPVIPTEPAAESQIDKTAEKTSDTQTSDTGEASTNDTYEVETTVLPERPDRILEIKTQKYAVRLSENRATLKSFLLNDYNESIDPDSPKLQMVDQSLGQGTMGLNFQSALAMDLKRSAFISDMATDVMEVIDQPFHVTFTHADANGFVIEKRFTFYPDSYLIDMDVVVKNLTHRVITDKIVLSIIKQKPLAETRYGFQGPSALIDNSLENIKIKKLKDQNTFPGNIDWIAYQDRYFISYIIPKNPIDAVFKINTAQEGEKIISQYIQDTGDIPSQDPKVFQYAFYLGPKSIEVLKSFDCKLERSVNFGWFDFIARPCLWLMNRLHGIIPNYGVAIIILTILTKILLWPLGSKSYKSMNEMKRIQPLMAEIREKYKDDKQRMNQEIMGLYRTYKINPVGGCLPMVVQIPVFFALYRMLYEAIELRHAPFFGWINDLSAPDRLFSFDFSIPFMEPPYGIPVLTLVMGASMFLQQKMSPPMGDPAQAKMMMLMPVVFTFIFINFSSGLVLYWLVNNLLGIFQQYYIQKKYA